ncbi:oxidoreductase [Bacillus sp. FJAT-18017]|uniref:Gfo/Idh/MocA family protein n=1 Tax=Bacillus sp. FJAT-18017 TaxID=1705566 RepID=UPI0006AED1A3|nr:Gfo/Idh/MocA family oxidoreductase [Bacillus sp. FJAT-18017]ALC91496.1 oxidoreductase [Bacillus sp. FJAT-18017]
MKLGIIGYGLRASHVVRELIKAEPSCQIKAIADPNQETIKKQLDENGSQVNFYKTADEMLDKEHLDGIVIGTRCSLHTEMALKVFPTGIPLFLEKPVAMNMEDLLRLKEGYNNSASPVIVSFPLRFTDIVQQVKAIIDSSQIGTVEHIQAINNVPYGGVYYQNWYRDEAETGGLFLQKATHDFDYLNFLAGSMPVTISAMESKQVFKGDKQAGLMCINCEEQLVCEESSVLKRLNNEEVHGEYCCFATDTGNHDSASALIQYETGMHAVYSQNFYARKGAKARGARLIGYRGTIEFDFYTNVIKVFMHHTNRIETHEIDTGNTAHFGGDARLARNYIQMMEDRAESIAPLESGILSALMCLKAKESAENKRFENIVL